MSNQLYTTEAIAGYFLLLTFTGFYYRTALG
jgi:hypothetical protein